MSVFSIIKRGREQAKEHSAKQAERVKEESVKLPYRHVPTHAATDALATAPASWKHDDRSKIREQNRRRSAMAASAHGNGGLPRVGSSSLAYVSYPSVYANPVVPLPKNYSYNSIPSSWRERMASTPEAAEGTEGTDYFTHPGDYKGKGKEVALPFIIGTGGTASPAFSSGRTSPLSSREVPAVVNGGVRVGVGVGIDTIRNQQNTGFSEGVKEGRNQVSRDISYNAEATPSSSRNSSSTRQGVHRLHPSRVRRMSETSTTTTVDGDVGVSVDVGDTVGVAIARGLENSSSSEDESRLRNRVIRDVSHHPERQYPSSRSSSATREGPHRLHPAAHSRRASDTNDNSHNNTVKTSNINDRHYPPPAKSTYFAVPRPTTGRRVHNADMPASSNQKPAGQFYFNPAPSSSASSIASIGMAISTAPTSAESTPPPSTAGDTTPTDPRRFHGILIDINAAFPRPRRFSLSDRGRRSVDTLSPSTDEPHVQAHQQGGPSRGRRLSKSRPQQSTEAEQPASVNRAKLPVPPVHFSRPTQAATESIVRELNQMEAKTPHSLISASASTTKRGSSRQRLSKDWTGNPQGDSAPRWSLFGRRNSVTTK